jgi:fructoselysine-6-P-deglycase FrlB-like protein
MPGGVCGLDTADHFVPAYSTTGVAPAYSAARHNGGMKFQAPPPMTYLEREIATQPDDWARAAARAGELADVLPRAGERVAVIGCGTSWFMAQAYAERREALGAGPTEAFAASEHHLERGYDRVVVLSRSGTTTEVVEAMGSLRGDVPTTAIVAVADTPIAERATHTIVLDDVDEQSVVQTRFATTALALLRASLGDDLEGAITAARAVLDEPEDAALRDAEQVTFLGRGWTIGLAHEAALKLRESCQAWAEAYPAMDYRHGPIAIAQPGRVVWALGVVPTGLAGDVEATGARFEHRDVDPMAELVRVHRMCLARALAAGLNPDQPRNLTRSVVLDD